MGPAGGMREQGVGQAAEMRQALSGWFMPLG
jgi:hypothetical protein